MTFQRVILRSYVYIEKHLELPYKHNNLPSTSTLNSKWAFVLKVVHYESRWVLLGRRQNKRAALSLSRFVMALLNGSCAEDWRPWSICPAHWDILSLFFADTQRHSLQHLAQPLSLDIIYIKIVIWLRLFISLVFFGVLPIPFCTTFSRHLVGMTAFSPSGANAVKSGCKNDRVCEVLAVKIAKTLGTQVCLL